MTYATRRPGPALDTSWRVVSGVVVVVGAGTGSSITLTAGGAWPGFAAVEDAARALKLADTYLLGDAKVEPVELTPTEAALASANVQAQFLRLGLVIERLKRVEPLTGLADNQEVLALALGTSRETVSANMRPYRAAQARAHAARTIN